MLCIFLCVSQPLTKQKTIETWNLVHRLTMSIYLKKLSCYLNFLIFRWLLCIKIICLFWLFVTCIQTSIIQLCNLFFQLNFFFWPLFHCNANLFCWGDKNLLKSLIRLYTGWSINIEPASRARTVCARHLEIRALGD